MYKAKERYNQLSTARSQFLDRAVECSELTLPHLIVDDLGVRPSKRKLTTPWQSVGSKAVVTLAAKLMLALLPPQTSFFKLQVRDDKLGEEIPAEIRSELDLSFAKMERMVMDKISASSDRVVVHQALKHLIVGGNALIFMGKEGLKNFPLNRYVVSRDGNGYVCEIVTKELINRKVLGIDVQPDPNRSMDMGSNHDEDAEVFTYVRRQDNGSWVWHQEVDDMIIPGSLSKAPADASPWLVLRMVSVDGEDYGRGRVEEFLGDLRSLEALSQALCEGSAAAAKVVFLVNPAASTKPQTIAKAGNGAIVQGRAEDVQVVQVGKTADFSTALSMAQQIERRIGEAFLLLNVRNSERTTAEEVRLTQMELESQLGGLFSLLTVEFLKPYLARTLLVMQRTRQLPKIPKDYVNPTIVAGVNALGRGQDREALTQFIGTIAQTLGPESLVKYIDPTEAIKRLAAAQGIDVLNLVKTPQQLQGDMQQQQQMGMARSLVDQAGQMASAPLMDPTKNPQAQELAQQFSQQQPPEQLDG